MTLQTLKTLMPGFEYRFDSKGHSWHKYRDGQTVMYVGADNDDQARIRFSNNEEWSTDASFLHADVQGVVYPDQGQHVETAPRLKTDEEIENERYVEIDHTAVAWMGKIVDVLNDNIGPLDVGYGVWSVKEVVIQYEGDTDTGFRIGASEFNEGLAVLVRGK